MAVFDIEVVRVENARVQIEDGVVHTTKRPFRFADRFYFDGFYLDREYRIRLSSRTVHCFKEPETRDYWAQRHLDSGDWVASYDWPGEPVWRIDPDALMAKWARHREEKILRRQRLHDLVDASRCRWPRGGTSAKWWRAKQEQTDEWGVRD